MKYKIAICDDQTTDRQYLTDLIKKWAVHTDHTAVISCFSSTESFMFHYADKCDYDILLLDSEMDAMDGVTLAKKIRQGNNNKAIQIIFITGFPEYISEGYEVSALHYLMKPAQQEKLFAVLDRAVIALQKTEPWILLPFENEMFRISVSQIHCAESIAHSVSIVTKTNSFPVKMSLSEIQRLLGADFIRCHRSYLVNLAHIARLSKTEVILDTGKILPLSRNAAPLVHKAFISYYMIDDHETI